MATPTIPTELLEPLPLDKPPAIMTEYELGAHEARLETRLRSISAAKAHLAAEGGSPKDIKWLDGEYSALLDEQDYVREIGKTPYADRLAEHQSMFGPEAGEVGIPDATAAAAEEWAAQRPEASGFGGYTIKPFEGPGYEDNVQNAPNGTTPCAICGKPVAGSEATWPHKAMVIGGGDEWGHEGSDKSDAGYMGVWPIDDECHMKYDAGVSAAGAASKEETFQELMSAAAELSPAGRGPTSAARYDYASERKPEDALDDATLAMLQLEKVGELEGYEVDRVNGHVVRDHVDIDFTEGGSPARYGYIPRRHLWVEGPESEYGAFALHERLEDRFMDRGDSYEIAHDKASQEEEKFRQAYPGGTIEDAQKWLHDVLHFERPPEPMRIDTSGHDVRDVNAFLRTEKPLDLMTATELSTRARDLEIERERLATAIAVTRLADEGDQLNREHDAVRAQQKAVEDLRKIPFNVRRTQYEADAANAERLKRGEPIAPGTAQAEVVRFSKRPKAEKKPKREKLSPEERSAKAKIGGAARMAALSEKQRSELGRKGLMAACGISPAVASGPSEPDYTPPDESTRWTPEERERLKTAGYMELAPASGPGFRCGSCKFATLREGGAPFASGTCSNPAVNTIVSATHGCCNHFLPNAEMGAPVVGSAFEEPVCEGGYRGAPCGELVTPQGKERSCYQLVPLAKLITSHNPDSWQKDPAYPAEVQERDYTGDKEEQAKVGRIARRPDPALLLSNNPTAVDGPPIVTGSGIVLGGNGRTMGLRLAYSMGTAQPYVEELAARAPMFGLTAEMVRSIDRPVLVRLVQGLDAATAADLADASSRYNEGLTGSLDEKARGVSDSRRLSPATLTTLAEGIERHESLRKAMADEGRTIVAALRSDGIITPQNSAAMVNPGGGLSELGKQRLEGAFLGLAAGSPDRLSQASPVVVQKLERLVPFLAAVKAVNPEADAIPTFQAAMDLIYQAESAGMTIDEFLKQGSLFDEPVAAPARPMSPAEAVEASIDQPAYEPFTPEAPVTVEAAEEAPPAEFDPEAAIKLIADDAASIRASDLERLFDENRGQGRWSALAAWVKNSRPDLASAVDRAMGIVETEDSERPAKFTYLGAKEAAERIRNGLKSRSKLAWSVKINPADGWVVIAAPPKRMVKGAMTEDDRRELAKLMGSGAHIHSQGLTLAPTGGFFEEYVDRANGREPATRGVSTNQD
jgi:hypothetical protein